MARIANKMGAWQSRAPGVDSKLQRAQLQNRVSTGDPYD